MVGGNLNRRINRRPKLTVSANNSRFVSRRCCVAITLWLRTVLSVKGIGVWRSGRGRGHCVRSVEGWWGG